MQLLKSRHKALLALVISLAALFMALTEVNFFSSNHAGFITPQSGKVYQIKNSESLRILKKKKIRFHEVYQTEELSEARVALANLNIQFVVLPSTQFEIAPQGQGLLVKISHGGVTELGGTELSKINFILSEGNVVNGISLKEEQAQKSDFRKKNIEKIDTPAKDPRLATQGVPLVLNQNQLGQVDLDLAVSKIKPLLIKCYSGWRKQVQVNENDASSFKIEMLIRAELTPKGMGQIFITSQPQVDENTKKCLTLVVKSMSFPFLKMNGPIFIEVPLEFEL